MIIYNPLVIIPNLNNTANVLFNLGGEKYEGTIPMDLIPEDFESLQFYELEYYFEDWADYIDNHVSKELKEKLEKVNLLENVTCNLLEKKGNLFYRLNTTVSLPEELVVEYANNQNDKDKVEALDNFWYWSCQLHHNQKEMLFSWLKKNKFQITKEGMIIAYRNVVKLDDEYTKNVDLSYTIVKGWKKNVKNYKVNRFGNLDKEGVNLHEAFERNKITYTHEYGSSKRSYYVLNEESSLNRNQVDFSNITCSHGLKCVASC